MAIDTPRYYPIDGKQYPSVTTVLSIVRRPFLEQWRGNVGNQEADRIAREAADLGSQVHEAAQRVNKSEPFTVTDPTVALILEAYQDWFGKAVEQVLAVEQVVWSHRYQFAGTADLVAILKGDKHPSVIDLKTSNALHREYGLQLAGYQMALIEMGTPVKRRLNLQLDKVQPGKWKPVREYRDHEAAERAFLHAVGLFRYFNPKG